MEIYVLSTHIRCFVCSYQISYFKPKQQTVVKERKWTEKERRNLIKGIEKFGIGNWKQMREDLLPEWVRSDSGNTDELGIH